MREMRRKKQALSDFECIEILENSTSGVLALLGDEDYAYAVPLSYVYDDGIIYFHCAKEGHKIDAIKKHDKVSFCVVAQDDVKKEKYTTYFKSVIAFGRISIMTDEKEIFSAIHTLAKKYFPEDTEAGRQAAVNKEYAGLCMLKLKIEHLSGKQATELLKK